VKGWTSGKDLTLSFAADPKDDGIGEGDELKGFGRCCSAWAAERAAGVSRAAMITNTHWFTGSVGVDNENLPVQITKMGCADPSGIVREAGFEPFKLQYCYELDAALVAARAEMVNSFTPEKAAAATAQATASGKSAQSSLKTGFCEIYDLGGDGVANYSSRAFNAAKQFIKLAKILDINFPERTRHVFIARAPMMFTAVWKLVSPFVPAATKAKIGIYGTSGYTEKMLAVMKSESIPAWLDERNPNNAEETPQFIGGNVPTDAFAD